MMNLEKMKQKKRTITKSRVKKSLLAAVSYTHLRISQSVLSSSADVGRTGTKGNE